MISTQRLIIISLLINVMMGLVHGIWLGDGEYDQNFIINTDIDNLEDYEQEYIQEDKLELGSTVGTYTGDTSLGDKLSWGNLDWSLVFKEGIQPWSFKPSDFNTVPEQIGAMILVVFRSMWFILIGFEVFLIWWAKKTT